MGTSAMGFGTNYFFVKKEGKKTMCDFRNCLISPKILNGIPQFLGGKKLL
jgi:hypothetical protein